MKKILIIDNDRLFLSCLKDFLGIQFQIETAYDGMKGIELTEDFQPDLILCDLKLPILDGYQVLKNIRDHINTAKIPFVFLSCFSEWSERNHALNLGANEYLSKPVRLRKLLTTINEQLKPKEIIQR